MSTALSNGFGITFPFGTGPVGSDTSVEAGTPLSSTEVTSQAPGTPGALSIACEGLPGTSGVAVPGTPVPTPWIVLAPLFKMVGAKAGRLQDCPPERRRIYQRRQHLVLNKNRGGPTVVEGQCLVDGKLRIENVCECGVLYRGVIYFRHLHIRRRRGKRSERNLSERNLTASWSVGASPRIRRYVTKGWKRQAPVSIWRFVFALRRGRTPQTYWEITAKLLCERQTVPSPIPGCRCGSRRTQFRRPRHTLSFRPGATATSRGSMALSEQLQPVGQDSGDQKRS